MGVDQRTGEGSKPRIPLVVSKSDRDHGTATTDNRNLGLTPAVTISRSYLSLSLYPIHILDTLVGNQGSTLRVSGCLPSGQVPPKIGLPERQIHLP